MNENLVYEIMNCVFPPIQKSCFVLLRHFYFSFIPEINYKSLKIGESDENIEEDIFVLST